MFEYQEALYRMRRGETDRAIQRDRVIGRVKAARLRALAIERGWLDAQGTVPSAAELVAALSSTKADGRAKVSSAEPYRALIEHWHAQGIQGVAIHRALARNHGYAGHYSSVQRLVKKFKASAITATMILDFAPGEAAQVDFGAGPRVRDPDSGEMVRTWFFVMTLCFSRHQYVEFVRDQTVATWLICHHHALRHFNGVPERLIIDNPKCAITRATVDDVQVQRAYGEFAQGYGFVISPCPPADPAKKGRVESGVKYVKRNFLPLREFADLHELNRQAHRWVMEEAGLRCHGTTREAPLALFESERVQLQALPERPPEVCAWARARVHRDGHIQHERCLYSVPFALIGQDVMARVSASLIEVFDMSHRSVATHLRGARPGARSTVEDHLPPAGQAWKMRTPRFCLEQAQSIGPACLALVTRLFGDRVLDRLRSVQGLLRLAERFDRSRLEAACLRMGEIDIVSVRTVRVMLERGLEQAPCVVSNAPSAVSAAYDGRGRFARDPRQLMLQ